MAANGIYCPFCSLLNVFYVLHCAVHAAEWSQRRHSSCFDCTCHLTAPCCAVLCCAVLQLHGGRTGIEGPGLSPNQRLGYAFAFVALPYLWARLNRYASQREWGHRQDDPQGLRAWRLLRAADAAHKLGQLINLWVFLYEGKYRWGGGGWVQGLDPEFANHCGWVGV